MAHRYHLLIMSDIFKMLSSFIILFSNGLIRRSYVQTIFTEIVLQVFYGKV